MLQRSRVDMSVEAAAALRRCLPGRLGRLVSGILGRPDRSLVEEDLAHGKLELLQVEAEWLAAGDDSVTADPILFVGTGDSVLVLFGQWLFDPHVVDPSYPETGFFRNFELLRAPCSGRPLKLMPAGAETIATSQVLDFESYKYLMEIPGAGDTFVARARTIEDVAPALRRLAQQT